MSYLFSLLLLALVTLEMCSAAAAWRADSLIRPVRSSLIPLRGGGPKSAADKKGGDKKPDDKKAGKPEAKPEAKAEAKKGGAKKGKKE
eukprot:CAMPEP_0179464768 /NCGR_PEP_ID=MMETSP0799-20121207/46499_1 /TAXON_ID=46947 /ORGANISM="Geminigera cryophila, Strain CCMP2564" /LENGTH=87 /DNA_ID=CAMNT_0021268711 /DNA_START=27 /DNA_END=290 /DNA_ORIENTATION=+